MRERRQGEGWREKGEAGRGVREKRGEGGERVGEKKGKGCAGVRVIEEGVRWGGKREK